MAFFPKHHIPLSARDGTASHPDFPDGGFVYYGYFAGIVPVYVGSLDPRVEAPCIACRNWVPEWTLDLVTSLCQLANLALECLGMEAGDFKVKITGRFDGKPLSKDPHMTM